MNPERWQQIKRLYNSALELEPGRREAYLKKACGGDESLQKEVERLLVMQPQAEGFLESPAMEMVARDLAADSTISEVALAASGRTISHYRIVKKIGEGGMGEVYLAEDQSLGRKVALKFLPSEMQSDPIAHMRFQREARSASALDHPYICSIHEVGEVEGKDYIVMEYVEGETLRDRLERGPLPLPEALHLAAEIVEAIEQAHEKQIIHRDLKPSNIMITRQGHAKVLDFGLAKQVMRAEQAVTQEDTLTALTREGTTVGTLAYMSPEQLRGQLVETRSDIFSFGIVFFEMLTGVHPFRQASPMDTAAAILNRAPAPLDAHLKNAPELLHKITARMLPKELAGRYSSIREVRADLTLLIKQLEQAGSAPSAAESRGLWQRLGKPVFVIPALLVMIALGYLAATTILQNRKTRWAHEVVLPQIEKLLVKDDWPAAYRIAVEAEKYIPNDPQLKEAFVDTSEHISVKTDPPAARVYFKEYAKGDESWEFAGLTPIENLRISRGFKEYKITRDGFDPVIGFSGSDQRLRPTPRYIIHLNRKLAKAGTTSPGMIWIEGGKYKPTIIGFRSLPEADLEPYQIDQFEVSNKEYQTFVDAGGYTLKSFWKHDFVKERRKLSWEEAVSGFLDKTGRLGPSTWELGHFPEGHGNYPVDGISWYEAAAYAEFAGKSLPTVYHWNKAAGVFDTSNTSMVQPVVMNSNFGDAGPAPVGKYRGISPYGAFDMAGNVREWSWSGLSNRRILLGGSWGVPAYLFYEGGELLSPFDRSVSNGFRCIKLSSGSRLSQLTMAEIPAKRIGVDIGKLKPVSDELYKIYSGLFSCDKGPLDPKIDAVEDSSKYCLRERVSFNAAYGGERVVAYLYLPKSTKKPYQSVIIFPGAVASVVSSIDAYGYNYEMFFKAGRAVIFPVYKGTFQRRPVDSSTPALVRDYRIMLYKDLARTLDYLETRPADFDINRVGYFGLSWGALIAPIMGALEKRIKVFILEGGGLITGPRPECDPLNFAPRYIAPTLLLNGRYDMGFPLETSAKPFFQLLGTPAKDKRMVLFDGGHLPPLTTDVKREMLLWLDRYLGPVR
jgi:formylglycine-generating enzyme required for sulfatase activity/dienelactone hydrolase/predicted Ser/Thr protein kinase